MLKTKKKNKKRKAIGLSYKTNNIYLLFTNIFTTPSAPPDAKYS